MNNTLDFETALEILKGNIFDDDCSYMGAVLFVAEAFDMSIDSVLEKLDW
jgi:hypothetical protein